MASSAVVLVLVTSNYGQRRGRACSATITAAVAAVAAASEAPCPAASLASALPRRLLRLRSEALRPAVSLASAARRSALPSPSPPQRGAPPCRLRRGANGLARPRPRRRRRRRAAISRPRRREVGRKSPAPPAGFWFCNDTDNAVAVSRSLRCRACESGGLRIRGGGLRICDSAHRDCDSGSLAVQSEATTPFERRRRLLRRQRGTMRRYGHGFQKSAASFQLLLASVSFHGPAQSPSPPQSAPTSAIEVASATSSNKQKLVAEATSATSRSLLQKPLLQLLGFAH